MTFETALNFTLRWEGGYSNHPNDPGGATMKGVTQKVYDAYRRFRGHPYQSVKFISDTEIANIYKQEYWLKSGCDRLPANLAIAHFDTAVNVGVSRAVRFLQECVGSTQDGVIGPNTLAKVFGADHDQLLRDYLNRREDHYRDLAENPKMAVFLKGWLNRLNSLRGELGV